MRCQAKPKRRMRQPAWQPTEAIRLMPAPWGRNSRPAAGGDRQQPLPKVNPGTCQHFSMQGTDIASSPDSAVGGRY